MATEDKKCLTITDIDELLYEQLGDKATRKDLKLITSAFLEILQNKVEEGFDIKIAKLLSINQVISEERAGRNPKTGEALVIAPRRYARCKIAPTLQKRIGEIA